MLDMSRRGRPHRNAQRHRAIVDAPVRRDRGITLTTETPVGISVGREHEQALGHRRLETADGVPQERGTGSIVGGEKILARTVRKTHMQMHAASGEIDERLRHERHEQSMTSCNAAQQTLEHHGLIDGTEGIVAMGERDFELPGRVLGHQSFGGDALGAGGGIDLIEHRREFLEACEAVGLDTTGVARDGARGRRIGLAQHIKLELHREHRTHAATLQPRNGVREHMSRISGCGLAAQAVHRQHDLRRRSRKPGCTRQRSCHRPANQIGVARIPNESCRIDVRPGDVETENGPRDGTSMQIESLELADARRLAPGDTRRVGDEKLYRLDVGVSSHKFFEFVAHSSSVLMVELSREVTPDRPRPENRRSLSTAHRCAVAAASARSASCCEMG